MRKIILDEWVSIDGFAARPDGAVDFFVDPKFSVQVDDDMKSFMQGIDTILLGSTTYKMFSDYWPKATVKTEGMADVINTTSKIVFSDSLEAAPWGKWEPVRVVKQRAEDAVSELKQLPGKDMVLWGSLSIAAALLKARLIDRLHLRVCPVAIGEGKRFFPPDESLVKARLVSEKRYDSGVMLLVYDMDAA